MRIVFLVSLQQIGRNLCWQVVVVLLVAQLACWRPPRCAHNKRNLVQKCWPLTTTSAQEYEETSSSSQRMIREQEGRRVASRLQQVHSNAPRPPVVFVPGLVASRMIAWKQKACIGPGIDIQDVVWLNLQKLVETLTFDKHCWLDCMKLGRNQSDPQDCKIRPDLGLHAVGEMSPGNIYTPPSTSVFTPLIRFFAKEMSYDSNSLHGAPYDWRLSPQELESRDSYFTNLQHTIETSVKRHKLPVIIVAHSMGNNLFLYFCEWMQQQLSGNKDGYSRWMQRHIWAHVGYAAPLLGAPAALKSVLSGHTFGLPISPLQARELMLGFPSTHYLNPRSSQSTTDPHYKNTEGDTVPADYDDVLVSIRKGTNHVANFSIDTVDDGRFFQQVAALFQDIRMEEKYATLRNLFDADPLQPLRKKYVRPPIPHVIMVYGVDLPTEVSYLYRIPESSNMPPASDTSTAADDNPISTEAITPILEEVYYEESFGEHILQDMRIRQEKGIFPLSALSSYFTPAAAAASQSTTETTSKKVDNNEQGNVFVAWYQQLVKHALTAFQPTDSASTDFNNSNATTATVEILEYSQSSVMCLAAESKPNTMTSCSARMLFSYEHVAILAADEDEEAARLLDEDHRLGNSDDTENSPERDFEEIPRRLSREHKAEIYGIRTKEYLQTPKQTVKYRHSQHIHSGDNTVPYVSLSYAKQWLNQTKYFVETLLNSTATKLTNNSTNKASSSRSTRAEDDPTGVPVVTSTATRMNLMRTAWTKTTSPSDNNHAAVTAEEYRIVEKSWSEYRPARIHKAKHVLDNWQKHKQVLDPAVELFYQETSLRSAGSEDNRDILVTASTTVVEVSGGDHLDISKNAYVYQLVFFELLLPRLEEDFCSENTAGFTCQPYFNRVAG